jgi:hypothetical protein
MVVNYFNLFSAIVPDETYSEFIVDSDTVLPDTISFQCFQTVSWRATEILKPFGRCKHFQFTPCGAFYAGKLSCSNAVE